MATLNLDDSFKNDVNETLKNTSETGGEEGALETTQGNMKLNEEKQKDQKEGINKTELNNNNQDNTDQRETKEQDEQNENKTKNN